VKENSSEEDLVRRLNHGDELALKIIFDEYYRPLTIFAQRYVGDISEAKEIVQEFFVRLWSRRADINVTFSFKMYLYQSVRNACLNYLESNKVAQKRLSAYKIAETTSDHALNKMMAAEQEELLMRAIDSLPEKCRQIFVLSRMDRLTNQEIAMQLGLSIKTVEAQISIALKRLAQWIILLLSFFCAC